MQSLHSDIDEVTLAALHAPQLPSFDSLLTPLVNDIIDSATPFALVLDDYHVVEAETVHDSVTFLLENQPPQMHLVIASRIDPSLPLSRLRAIIRME